MVKKIWVSSLSKDEVKVQQVLKQLKAKGLEPQGHFWEDDLKNMAWMKPREELLKEDVALWGILADEKGLSSEDVRYGLALLALTVQADRGLAFPILFLWSEGTPPSVEELPTPLKGAEVLPLSDPSWSAKVVARAFVVPEPIQVDYRLNVYGNPQIGQWFEVGPQEGNWKGALFGVSEGEILFHAVGPKDRLPARSVLNYPMKGMKITMGQKEYTAWAVQNELDPQTSYFVKVEGHPSSVIFAPFASEDEAEVYFVQLK